MESVTINFKLTGREFLAACRVLTLGGTRQKLRVFAAPPLWAAATTALLTAGLGYELTSALFFTGSAVALLSALYYFTLVELPRRSFRGDRKFRDPVTFTFTPAHIFVRTRLVEARMDWRLYTSVLEGRDCYVLVYGRDVRLLTPLPKRAFQSREQEQAFRALAFARLDDKLRARRPEAVAPAEDDYSPASLQPPDWR
jgi:hypothetical protein